MKCSGKDVWMRDQGVDGSARDGNAIEENPLSMDGMFLGWIGFPARDGWSIVFFKFRTGVLGCAVEGFVVGRGFRGVLRSRQKDTLVGQLVRTTTSDNKDIRTEILGHFGRTSGKNQNSGRFGHSDKNTGH